MVSTVGLCSIAFCTSVNTTRTNLIPRRTGICAFIYWPAFFYAREMMLACSYGTCSLYLNSFCSLEACKLDVVSRRPLVCCYCHVLHERDAFVWGCLFSRSGPTLAPAEDWLRLGLQSTPAHILQSKSLCPFSNFLVNDPASRCLGYVRIRSFGIWKVGGERTVRFIINGTWHLLYVA